MNHRSSRRASIAVFACWLVSLAGCAVPLTRDSDVYKVKPKLILNQGEFRVVRTVQGRASCPYFLWLDLPDFIQIALKIPTATPALNFALGNAALRVRAMEDMRRKHDLVGKPQVLHNFVEEWSLANYLGLFAIQRVTITAEVIEFLEKGR
jgi:hypothetical protein